MSETMPRKRPFGVTLLLWLVLMVIVWGAVRVSASLRGWEVLAEYGSSLGPLYFLVTGAGWSVAGGALLWSLFTARPWTRRAMPIFALVWLIEYWIERGIFFQASNPNLWFALLGSILMSGIVLVCTFHKSTQVFLTRSEEYEQQIENPDPE
jgi:hypothetical protein